MVRKTVVFINVSVQFSSVVQSCLTVCDPMNRSMPGLPIHHQLLESTQTHVHCVGDAIQPSYPLSIKGYTNSYFLGAIFTHFQVDEYSYILLQTNFN